MRLWNAQTRTAGSSGHCDIGSTLDVEANELDCAIGKIVNDIAALAPSGLRTPI